MNKINLITFVIPFGLKHGRKGNIFVELVLNSSLILSTLWTFNTYLVVEAFEENKGAAQYGNNNRRNCPQVQLLIREDYVYQLFP